MIISGYIYAYFLTIVPSNHSNQQKYYQIHCKSLFVIDDVIDSSKVEQFGISKSGFYRIQTLKSDFGRDLVFCRSPDNRLIRFNCLTLT